MTWTGVITTTDRTVFCDIVAQHALGLIGAHFALTRRAITSERRDQVAVDARRCFCWLMTRRTTASSARIGRYINRDHTTVLHALRTVRELAANDPLHGDLSRLDDDLTDIIAGGYHWTPQRDDALSTMWRLTAMTDAQIAASLGCQPAEVAVRAEALGLMTDEWPVLSTGAA